MTAPSNTPDKPMTREEAIDKASTKYRYSKLHTKMEVFRGGFSAGESFARQSILKEAEEIVEILLASHGCWTDGGPEIPEEISAHFDIGMANARKIVAFCAKLKGEGV